MTTAFNADEVIRQVTEKLQGKFSQASPDEIRRIVAEEVGELEKQPVRDYVSVLSERAAKKRLQKKS